MGIDISEHYTFIGKTEQIKSFYGFLKQYDIENYYEEGFPNDIPF